MEQPPLGQVIAQIVISLDSAGKLEVKATPGTMESRMLSFGMLELAKVQIGKHNDNLESENAKRIVAPPMGLDSSKLRAV